MPGERRPEDAPRGTRPASPWPAPARGGKRPCGRDQPGARPQDQAEELGRAAGRRTRRCTACGRSAARSRSPRSPSPPPAGRREAAGARRQRGATAARRTVAAAVIIQQRRRRIGERRRRPSPPAGRVTRPKRRRHGAASPAAGQSPTATQPAARTTIGNRMAGPASWACAAWSLRGSPRKTMPKALVKQAAASPPMSASAPIATSAGTRPPPSPRPRSRPGSAPR